MFEKIRNNNVKNYGSYPSHYLIVPGFSWDAILEMKNIELELIPDPDMYIFFEKGIRGGISYSSNRYSKSKINIWNLSILLETKIITKKINCVLEVNQP